MAQKVDHGLFEKGEREARSPIHHETHSLSFHAPTSTPKSLFGNELLIGKRLRAFRKQRGMNIRLLAEKCGVSVNTLSMIENDRTYPNVFTLKLLADGLGIPVVSFFEEENSKPSVSYQPQGSRVKTTCFSGTLEKLGEGLPAPGAEPILVTLEKQAGETPLIQHPGCEFIYCLEGSVIGEISDSVYTLMPGDSLIFNANLPHRWKSIHPAPSKILVVFYIMEDYEQPFDLYWKN